MSCRSHDDSYVRSVCNPGMITVDTSSPNRSDACPWDSALGPRSMPYAFVATLDRDRERDLPDVSHRRIQRSLIEIILPNAICQRARGREEQLVGQRSGTACDGAKTDAGKHVRVVALRRDEGPAVIDRPVRKDCHSRKPRAHCSMVRLFGRAFGPRCRV